MRVSQESGFLIGGQENVDILTTEYSVAKILNYPQSDSVHQNFSSPHHIPSLLFIIFLRNFVFNESSIQQRDA